VGSVLTRRGKRGDQPPERSGRAPWGSGSGERRYGDKREKEYRIFWRVAERGSQVRINTYLYQRYF
jgi:hypothetical protein